MRSPWWSFLGLSVLLAGAAHASVAVSPAAWSIPAAETNATQPRKQSLWNRLKAHVLRLPEQISGLARRILQSERELIRLAIIILIVVLIIALVTLLLPWPLDVIVILVAVLVALIYLLRYLK